VRGGGQPDTGHVAGGAASRNVDHDEDPGDGVRRHLIEIGDQSVDAGIVAAVGVGIAIDAHIADIEIVGAPVSRSTAGELSHCQIEIERCV
jgi:hypothetical protein